MTGRDVQTYVLFMVIAAETDEEAQAKWQHYNDGADMEAINWLMNQGGKDTTSVQTPISVKWLLAYLQ